MDVCYGQRFCCQSSIVVAVLFLRLEDTTVSLLLLLFSLGIEEIFSVPSLFLCDFAVWILVVACQVGGGRGTQDCLVPGGYDQCRCGPITTLRNGVN